jgi:DNA-binding transcriptional LysR family regulator
MSTRRVTSRVYKDSTAQQLRSFYESARLGSITAAANYLGLSTPTVCQQVRALEREFGEPLLKRHRRGSSLTEGGKLLVDLVGPVVANLATLKQRYREARVKQLAPLTVATTPRILADHLPECVVEYRKRHPQARLMIKDMVEHGVHTEVESGAADLGLVLGRSGNLEEPWMTSPWLEFEPLYDMDIVLITPRDHPLARQRRVVPQDLRGYPLVNAPQAMVDPVALAVLKNAGVLDSTPHLVETLFFAGICRYVELGFGIGLIPMLPDYRLGPKLHVRVMSQYFGKPTVHALRRKDAPSTQGVAAFTEIVKERLNRRRRR